MTPQQRQAHAKMLATLPVRTHEKMFTARAGGKHDSHFGKRGSENGRKGRIAAKLSTPVHLRGTKAHIPVLTRRKRA